MNTSSDAAEQIVRMSLEGFQVTAKVVGSGAKDVAALLIAIMKDKRRENIKIEIIRHTAFSFFILVALMLAALIEVYASNSFLSLCISYF